MATSRTSMVNTMVVLRDPGEVYLLCHTGGDDAVSWVEQLHPTTLETLRRSPDLPGGPTWPGGLAAHADGSQLLDWLGRMPSAPQQVYVVHGEPEAADTLRQRIERALKWRVAVPEHGSTWPT